MPKNRVFYNLFENVAETVGQMGGILKQLVNEPNVDTRASLTSKLEDLEHKNDEHTHNLFTELGRNFITPFDREDISSGESFKFPVKKRSIFMVLILMM